MERRRRVFPGARRRRAIRSRFSGTWICHQVLKGDGMHRNRLFQESVEEHTSGARCPAVKAEGKFVQVGLHMIDAEGALVCTEQPSFHESRNAVNAREHVVRIPTRTLDRCASMHIVVSCRQRIGGQSVGKYLGAGFDITRKEGAQCVGLSIGDDLNAATAEPFWLNLLDGHSNQYLARSASSSFPRASATQHRFIDFHIARKSRALGVSNGTTKSLAMPILQAYSCMANNFLLKGERDEKTDSFDGGDDDICLHFVCAAW